VARDLLPLGLPLFCGAVGLSWYNWARFGSISETGVSYILAGPYYLREHLAEFFSPVYVLQNLYNYVLLPFQLQAQFPFVSAARGRMDNLVPFYRLPAAYFTNQVTGLLFATPFCLFALVPAVRWIAQRGGPGAGANQTDPQARQLWVWVIASLAGGCLATFSLLQLFLWAAMRYIEDFMPALILLSLLGFWQGFALLEARPMTGRVYAMIGTILAIGSIAIGMLLPIGGNARLFVTNPLMMEWLARFFPR
jgi:hypothetical protein